ncbi:MAG: hypothetical protein U9N14_03540 [Pseudomonadota bacterium]|nr:hypothetical protein [Pseudomonadota bacterium]
MLKKIAQFGEFLDIRRNLFDLFFIQAQQNARQLDVLVAGGRNVQSQGGGEQGRDFALRVAFALGRPIDAGHDAQQAALAGTVAADQADLRAGRNLKAHLVQRSHPGFGAVRQVQNTAYTHLFVGGHFLLGLETEHRQIERDLIRGDGHVLTVGHRKSPTARTRSSAESG